MFAVWALLHGGAAPHHPATLLTLAGLGLFVLATALVVSRLQQ